MRKEEFTKGLFVKIKETLTDAGVPDFIIRQVDVVTYVIIILIIAIFSLVASLIIYHENGGIKIIIRGNI